MDENRNAKKRVIFDENPYYGGEGTELAVEDLMGRDDLTDDEVRETYTDSELFEHAMEMRDFDYREEMDALKAFFDGEPSAMSSESSEHGGNPVIASATIGRWDGTRSGFSVFDDFDDVMHGQDSPFKDCEIQKVWDENGQLFIHGAHHDGSVTVELRQLSDTGVDAYEAITDAWAGEPFEANGRTYDGSARSVTEAMRDLWDAIEPPRYMERAYGCPAEEWEEPEKGVSLADMERSNRDAAVALSETRSTDAPARTEQTI